MEMGLEIFLSRPLTRLKPQPLLCSGIRKYTETSRGLIEDYIHLHCPNPFMWFEGQGRLSN